jgi:nitrate/nitrite transport system permease protein
MNMPAKKIEAAAVLTNTPAAVVELLPKRLPVAEKYVKMARETAVRVLPPLIVLALLMLFWELVCPRRLDFAAAVAGL